MKETRLISHGVRWHARAIASHALFIGLTIYNRQSIAIARAFDVRSCLSGRTGEEEGRRGRRAQRKPNLSRCVAGCGCTDLPSFRWVRATHVGNFPNSSIYRQEQTARFMIIDCRSQRRQISHEWVLCLHARVVNFAFANAKCFAARDCSILRRLHVSRIYRYSMGILLWTLRYLERKIYGASVRYEGFPRLVSESCICNVAMPRVWATHSWPLRQRRQDSARDKRSKGRIRA